MHKIAFKPTASMCKIKYLIHLSFSAVLWSVAVACNVLHISDITDGQISNPT
jgi:hypothetical protein